MKILLILAVALSALSVGQRSLAAELPNLNAAMTIVDARQKNAALMKQYTWESRTELIENGAVKDIRIEQVTYGPEGQPQRTLVNDQPAPLPSGFIRKMIAQKDQEKTAAYITGLRSLLDQYSLATAGKIIDFITRASLEPAANGQLQVTGGSVAIPGDTVSLWVNTASRKAQRMKIMTFYEGDEVNVSITFKTISNGLTYPAYSQVDVFGKGLSLQVQNFNYINQNQ